MRGWNGAVLGRRGREGPSAEVHLNKDKNKDMNHVSIWGTNFSGRR